MEPNTNTTRCTPAARSSKDALRIQAAAVAAQQAALGEEESRLEKRRLALEQQESQVAAHLEEKHRRLVEMRDQARQERQALQEERAAHEKRIHELTSQLHQSRAQVEATHKQAQAERRRVQELHQRLKRRWHRAWSAERAALQSRQDELARQRAELEQAQANLHREQGELMQGRLRFNGEAELTRRQLQAERQQLHKDQQQWQKCRDQAEADLQERNDHLQQRVAAVGQSEHDLGQEKLLWQGMRARLEAEVEGLDNRVRNHRRKMVEQEQELIRLEATVFRDLQNRLGQAPALAALPSLQAIAFVPSSVDVESDERRRLPQQTQTDQHGQLVVLEKVAGELADQRLLLQEKHRILVQSQQQLQQEREAVAAELEAVALRLQQREQSLESREQALEAEVSRSRQYEDQLAQQRQQLESWQLRLATRTAGWEAERERRLAELQTREELAERHRMVFTNLSQQWQERRQRELEQLQADQAMCEKLRHATAALRDDWLRRLAELDQQQRDLASQSSVIEQYRQAYIRKSRHPGLAEKRLERLRRRCAAHHEEIETTFLHDRRFLEEEAARIDQRFSELHQYAGTLANQEIELSSRETAWELARTLAETEATTRREELQLLRNHCEAYERQIAELNQEIEQVAWSVLDHTDTSAPRLGQAA